MHGMHDHWSRDSLAEESQADRERCIPPNVDSISETISFNVAAVSTVMLQKQCLLHNFSELRNSHVVVIPVEIISDHLSKGKLRGDDSKLQLIEVLKHQNEYVKTSLVRFQTTSTDEPLEQFTYWYSDFSITELLT